MNLYDIPKIPSKEMASKVLEITREYGEKAIETLQLKMVYARTAARKAKINRKIVTWQRLLIKLAATPVDSLPSECETGGACVAKADLAAEKAMALWQSEDVMPEASKYDGGHLVVISPNSETEK